VKGSPDRHDLKHSKLWVKIVRASFDELNVHVGFGSRNAGGLKHGWLWIHRNQLGPQPRSTMR
jgi:hypothetical protein